MSRRPGRRSWGGRIADRAWCPAPAQAGRRHSLRSPQRFAERSMVGSMPMARADAPCGSAVSPPAPGVRGRVRRCTPCAASLTAARSAARAVESAGGGARDRHQIGATRPRRNPPIARRSRRAAASEQRRPAAMLGRRRGDGAPAGASARALGIDPTTLRSAKRWGDRRECRRPAGAVHPIRALLLARRGRRRERCRRGSLDRVLEGWRLSPEA